MNNKKFVAFEAKKTKQIYGGYKVTLKVYSIKQNKLLFLWLVKYYTASTMWDNSEVYNFLINNKYIPKKAFDYSINWNSWGWYYLQSNPYCKIQIISDYIDFN